MRPAGGIFALSGKKDTENGEASRPAVLFRKYATGRNKAIAIYHLSIKIISRGKGKSAVAAAAYRAGEKIANDYDGMVHDYTRKGGVVHTEIILPEHAPDDYSDRAVLWNAVELAERNRNAQLAREIELALPAELSRGQGIALVRDYVRRQFVDKGMCADVCIHDKNDGNPHAHIMLTLRPIDRDGAWAAKSKKEYVLDANGERILLKSGAFKTRKVYTVDWNDPARAEEWRSAWAGVVNAALERGGHAERIDHRSYERQGVERIPTVHLGVAASQMERRGIATERGNINREIEVTNREIRMLRARLNKLKSWLTEAANNNEPPTLADVIRGILDKRERQGRYAQIANLKSAANMLNFLVANGIRDMAGLQEKVQAMYVRFNDARSALKKNERRAKTLDEHLSQSEIYLKHKALFKQYRQLQNPAKRDAFYEKHRAELFAFDTANRYLKGVMNGRTALPIQVWRDERNALAAERKRLYAEYTAIKEEVREVEQIRRGVEDIVRSEARDAQRERVSDMER